MGETGPTGETGQTGPTVFISNPTRITGFNQSHIIEVTINNKRYRMALDKVL
jgi:hypothetical protein